MSFVTVLKTIVLSSIFMVACQQSNFKGSQYKIGPDRDQGTGGKDDLMNNSAFTDPANDSDTGLGNTVSGSDFDGADADDGIGGDSDTSLTDPNAPASDISVLRLCSRRYTQQAGTNLLEAKNGVMVALHPQSGNSKHKSHFFDNPADGVAIRDAIFNTGKFKLPLGRVHKGTYQMLMCDVAHASGCRSAMEGSGSTFRFGGRKGLIAAAFVSVSRGRLSAMEGSVLRNGKIEVLANKNLQEQQMVNTFQSIFAQAQAEGGGSPMPFDPFAMSGMQGGQVDPKELEDCDDFASPLIIDTDNQGIDMRAPLQGVEFDINADGSKNLISWPKRPESMFLTLDINGNGLIDNGSELFGDNSAIPAGHTGKPRNGFEALKRYDGNADGVIDSRDAIYSRLRLWSDKNGDATTDAGELLTLKEMNVLHIDLTYKEGDERDEWGNATKQRSVAKIGEKLRMIVDIWFRRIN